MKMDSYPSVTRPRRFEKAGMKLFHKYDSELHIDISTGTPGLTLTLRGGSTSYVKPPPHARPVVCLPYVENSRAMKGL